MNIAEALLSKLTTKITLPETGQEIEIRKLSVPDYMEFGALPKLLKQKGEKVLDEDAEIKNRIFKMIVCNCVVGPGNFRIVNKAPQDSNPQNGELSIFMLPQKDVQFIVTEVEKISGNTKEVADSAKPFPEQPEVAGQPA